MKNSTLSQRKRDIDQKEKAWKSSSVWGGFRASVDEVNISEERIAYGFNTFRKKAGNPVYG